MIIEDHLSVDEVVVEDSETIADHHKTEKCMTQLAPIVEQNVKCLSNQQARPRIAQPERRLGHGPANYYLLKHTNATIGFIGALTNQHFCDTCNKMRLTADGKIRPCLGNHVELDLRTTLRHHTDDAALRELLLTALRLKPFEHQFRENYTPCRPMTAIGG